MLESLMLKNLKSKLKEFPCELTNIETGSVSVGVPDWYLKTMWNSVWIEAKQIEYWPKKISTTIKIKFRPGQWPWIQKHLRLQEQVLLMITHEDKWYCFKDIKKEYTQHEFETLSVIPQDFMDMPSEKIYNFLNTLLTVYLSK